MHTPFPLQLVFMNAQTTASFSLTRPQVVSQMLTLKSICGFGEIKGK